MKKSQFAEELYKRYGFVTRARGPYLYTKKNVRIIDLYQENGRAILGWDAGSAYTYFKNFMTKGLMGSFITEDKARIEKAVSTLLNSSRKVFYFNCKEDALKSGLNFSLENTSVYMPWNQENKEWEKVDSIILTPPLPWTDNLYILAVKEELCQKAQNLESFTAKSQKIAFALEAAITRAIYDLIAALKEREEKDWFIYDPVITKYWERKGPYLYTKIPQEKYDDFVLHCLDLGIAVNPSYNCPSIIPYGADKGNFTKLKNSPFTF